MSVSDSVTVPAEALEIWAALADPSQMPRWSRENTGAEVPSPGTPLRVGETFVGANKRGRARWHTSCLVTASEPGRRFAFDVRAIGLRHPRLRASIATWDYTLTPTDDGATVVTETWTDGRSGWPDILAAGFDKVATGGSLFSDFQRRNIASTLKRLREDFDAPI